MKEIKELMIDKTLVIIILIFLLFRILILLTSDSLFNPEGCILRTSIKDIINGAHLPLLDYQLEPYGGGFLLVVLLAVPISYILGVSVFSFKLVGLFFSLGILIIIYLLLKKVYNKKVAVIASFLIIFSPPYYTIRNLMTMGNYLESMFFSFVIIYLFFDLIKTKGNKKIKISLLGFFIGFGIWVYYSTIVAFLNCILFVLITRKFKIINKKNVLIFIIAFLVGFSPWICSNLSTSFDNTQRLGDMINLSLFNTEIIKLKLQKLSSLLIIDIPASFYFKDIFFISKKFFAYSYYLIFIFSFLILFIFNIKKINKKFNFSYYKPKKGYFPEDLFFLSYFIIYIIIFILTNLEIRYKFYSVWDVKMVISHSHLLLIHPFIMIIIAVAIFRLLSKKNFKKVGFGIFIFLISIGLIQTIYLVDGFNLKNLLSEEINYNSFGRSVGWKHSQDILDNDSICFRIENESFIKGCFAGIGEGSLYYGADIKKGEKICDSINPKYRKYCYMGMGGTIASHPEEINRKCLSLSKENIKFCFAGAASEFISSSNTIEGVRRLCNKYINKKYVEFCYNGLDMLYN